MRLFWCLLLYFLPVLISQAQSDVCESTTTMIVGERGRVLPDVRLNIRPEPNTQLARLGTLSGGMSFDVVGDAVCSEGFVWWQIEVDETIGWIVESDPQTEESYIEPRGQLIPVEQPDGSVEYFVRTASANVEHEGCMRPPDDYEQVQLGYATLNQRTLFMLDHAQRIYESLGGEVVNFRQLITQGSYNAGGVSASFGTHDGGGAVDISVRAPQDFSIMREEIPTMLRALRIAGFAAWLRDTGELYYNSPIHIHAIAIGDAELSEIARQQVEGDFGYLRGFNGLPPEEGDNPIPDAYGDPLICDWMHEIGLNDWRERD